MGLCGLTPIRVSGSPLSSHRRHEGLFDVRFFQKETATRHQ